MTYPPPIYPPSLNTLYFSSSPCFGDVTFSENSQSVHEPSGPPDISALIKYSSSNLLEDVDELADDVDEQHISPLPPSTDIDESMVYPLDQLTARPETPLGEDSLGKALETTAHTPLNTAQNNDLQDTDSFSYHLDPKPMPSAPLVLSLATMDDSPSSPGTTLPATSQYHSIYTAIPAISSSSSSPPEPTTSPLPSSSPPSSSPVDIFSSSPLPSSQSSTLLDIDSDKLNSHTDIIDATLILRQLKEEEEGLLPSSSPYEIYISESSEMHGTEAETQAEAENSKTGLVCDEVDTVMQSSPPSTSSPPILVREAASSPGPSGRHSPLIHQGKRRRSHDELPEENLASTDENPSKRLKKEMPPPQSIRRPGSTSNQLSRKKLTAPFRSPLMQKTPSVVDSAPLTELELGFAKQLVYPSTAKKNNDPETIYEPKTHTDTKKSHTSRAAKQFKSPLMLSSSSGPSSFSAVQLAPTIQSLERKIQVLKRAIKVKRDGEEEELEGLIKKWKDVGREVAWEVWGLVKDNQTASDQGGWGIAEGGRGKGKGKRGFEEGWGWGENGGAIKRTKVEGEISWGWDTVDENGRESEEFGKYRESEKEVEEQGVEKGEDTLGTMLRQFGIAPETLGWNEEEGDFVG